MPKRRKRLQNPVRLIANIDDRATGLAYNEYQFTAVGGEKRKCLVERSKAVESRPLAEILLNNNADLPQDPKRRGAFIAKLIRQRPRLLVVCAAKVGWADSGHIFIRHRGVAGHRGSEPKLRPPIEQASRYQPQVRGDLDEWKKQIGQTIRWSTVLQLTAAATFAAPLVRLLQIQPFTVVIFGSSSIGKSSAILVAGSIVGLGSKDAIPNWNVTKSALSELACHFNDHVFLIDETGSSNLPRAKQYELMKATTYTYAEGVDALRHSRSGFATGKQQADAAGILITTSEYSFDQLAGMSGQRRDDGEIARAINVPALSTGATSIFDIWPAKLTPANRANWVLQKFARLRESCPKYHGTAFKAYMDYIVAKGRDELAAEAQADMAVFLRHLKRPLPSRAIEHAARNFALVYAAGVQAIRATLLPLTEKKLLRSIARCFNDSITCLELPDQTADLALAELRTGLNSTPLLEKVRVTPGAMVDGFYRLHRGQKLFAIRPAVFRSWFTAEGRYAAALINLQRRGLLLLRDGVQLEPGAPAINLVTTFEKIGGSGAKREQGRWIRFYDPLAIENVGGHQEP